MPKGNYEDGLLSKSRQDARRMARTITVGIANDAKDQFYRDNSDVVLGVEWLDTLDGRTCFDCASLSRMQWKVDEPHPIPPLHPNCRCVLLPVTALSMLVDEARPAAKSDFMADAKRMYEAKYPGKRFEDLSESTRKKYYYDAIHEYEARTGQPAFELVHGRVSFKDYFENVMTEQQRKDWLGPRRYELWKTGKYKFEDFVTPYPDKRMTVDMLKSADRAGLGGNLLGQTHQASQEAIRFTQEYIAINVKTDGLNTKSLNAINYRLAEKMKKYGIDKFDDFLPTDNEYAILGVYPDNKKFAFRADNWNMIVSNPSNYYRKNKGKPGRIRRFAFDSPDDVINHCIDHEVGHAIFNKSTISNKEKLLHNLYINNNFGRDLSQYATESAREFFAENFAIYERGGNLREDVRDFIKRIIENAD